jgi:hypothetical protein
MATNFFEMSSFHSDKADFFSSWLSSSPLSFLFWSGRNLNLVLTADDLENPFRLILSTIEEIIYVSKYARNQIAQFFPQLDFGKVDDDDALHVTVEDSTLSGSLRAIGIRR